MLSSMNSFDWGGIQSVTVDGQLVEFSVASQSRTDWTQDPGLRLGSSGSAHAGACLDRFGGNCVRRAVKVGHTNPVK